MARIDYTDWANADTRKLNTLTLDDLLDARYEVVMPDGTRDLAYAGSYTLETGQQPYYGDTAGAKYVLPGRVSFTVTLYPLSLDAKWECGIANEVMTQPAAIMLDYRDGERRWGKMTRLKPGAVK